MKNTQQANKRLKNKNKIKVQTKEKTLKPHNGRALRGDLSEIILTSNPITLEYWEKVILSRAF
jgi:hypothetical protein